MVDIGRRTCVATLVAVLAVVACGFAAVAVADHGSPANFTVYPQENEDRSPGADDANYVMSSAGADAFESDGLEVVDYYWLESEQANFDACTPDNARVFGIDRGNNNSGTQTDDDLLQHMKDYSIDGNRITLDLYDEDDLGGDSIHLNPPDATVAVLADCIENTGDAGWYQFEGYVNGTTYDGGYEEIHLESHYFWIGDFEDEEEARSELGPPPSESGEDESTDEADASDSSSEDDSEERSGADDGSEDGDRDGGDESANEDSTDEDSADDETADDETADGSETGADDGSDADGDAGSDGGAGDDGTDQQDGADEPAESEDDDDDDGSTPASGDGPGFGAAGALVALLTGGALLARRR